MTFTNEQLIMLDAMAYYSLFSDIWSISDFWSGEKENNNPTVEDVLNAIYNYYDEAETTCFNDILGLSDEDLGMSKILEHIQRDEQLKRLQIVYPYSYDGEGNKISDSSTSSVCLVDPATNEVYVIFGGNYGTGKYFYSEVEMGTWADNFIGPFVDETLEQKRAMDFYVEAIDAARAALHLSDSEELNITVSGHSAAGNQAQYVTIAYAADDRYQSCNDISNCVSVDGQGFSAGFLERYATQIAGRADKITSILPSTSIVGSLMYRIPGIRQLIINIDCIASSMTEINTLEELIKTHMPNALLQDDGSLRSAGIPSALSLYLNDLTTSLVGALSREDSYNLDSVLEQMRHLLVLAFDSDAMNEISLADYLNSDAIRFVEAVVGRLSDEFEVDIEVNVDFLAANISALLASAVTLQPIPFLALLIPLAFRTSEALDLAGDLCAIDTFLAQKLDLIYEKYSLAEYGELQQHSVNYPEWLAHAIDGGAKYFNIDHQIESLYTGDENDYIYLGQYADEIHAGAGDDVMTCYDLVTAHFYGGDGYDYLVSGSAHDKLFGDGGNDTIYGNAGNDTLYGGHGNDMIDGGVGNDYILGGQGDDIINGGAGDDDIYGGDGKDILNGSLGDDFISGADDDDTYIFDKSHAANFYDHDVVYDQYGYNTILFHHITQDQLALTMSANEKDLIITVAETGASMTIQNYFELKKHFEIEFDGVSKYYTVARDADDHLTLQEQPHFGGSGGSHFYHGAIDAIKDRSVTRLVNQYTQASQAQPPRDPLVIDLDGDGIQLLAVDDPENHAYFDLDKNGFAEKTAWIGARDGFLVLDRNGNGIIDNGGELFSDQVEMQDGGISSSGFEALEELDENQDGLIDENDSDFSNLKVWVDENGDGKSDNELICKLF